MGGRDHLTPVGDGEAGYALPIHELMARVMEQVQVIGKGDSTSGRGGPSFNFRGVDATVNVIGPALRAHGIVCVPHKTLDMQTERYETTSGAQMMGVILRVRFRFYGPSGDWVQAEAWGQAADSGDKAVSKAHSVAWRTALLESFTVPTGEPDPDHEVHQRRETRPPEPVDIGHYLEAIDLAGSLDELEQVRVRLSRLRAPGDQLEILRKAYTARKNELTPGGMP